MRFFKKEIWYQNFSLKKPNQVLRTMPEFLSHLHPNDQVTKSVTELPTEAIVYQYNDSQGTKRFSAF